MTTSEHLGKHIASGEVSAAPAAPDAGKAHPHGNNTLRPVSPAVARGAPPRGMSLPDYRCRLLVAPRVLESGVEHGADRQPARLDWSAVRAARAAEVGEPQGVRTIVFDLWVEEDGVGLALRMDAEPGEEAQRVAQRLLSGLGDRARRSLGGLAADGMPTRWYPDLASFEEDGAEELAQAGPSAGPATLGA